MIGTLATRPESQGVDQDTDRRPDPLRPRPRPRPDRCTDRRPDPAAVGRDHRALLDRRDCATNVSPALNAWIAGRPNGSTLIFPSGSCYRLGGDEGIIL